MEVFSCYFLRYLNFCLVILVMRNFLNKIGIDIDVFDFLKDIFLRILLIFVKMELNMIFGLEVLVICVIKFLKFFFSKFGYVDYFDILIMF